MTLAAITQSDLITLLIILAIVCAVLFIARRA